MLAHLTFGSSFLSYFLTKSAKKNKANGQNLHY